MNAFQSLLNIFSIPDLRKRIIFTFLLLAVYRLGAHIPTPGVDPGALHAFFQGSAGGALGFLDIFSGGALRRLSVFDLGIMPYISASIILQLLGAVVPYFQKLQQEGEEGRRQINTYTRYFTVLLAFAQGIAIAISLQSTDAGGGQAVVSPAIGGVGFAMMAATIFTAGTIFLMWIGEQITEKGIGNGISLIIFIGIIARLPQAIVEEYELISTRNVIVELIILAGLIAIIAMVVMFTQAVRKIPVQYAKRIAGNKTYGGQTSFIPITLTTANVMPIIFASSIMFIPNSITQYFPNTSISLFLQRNFKHDDPLYSIVLALLIIFFTFFYTAIVFNPRDVAENMRKNGGFVPGVRPGKPTEEYIDNILTKVTVPGSLFLAIIAILPVFASNLGVSAHFSSFFGGTSLLIIVGVALDTLKQIESYLLMRHYDGFMKSGKLRGRLGRQTMGTVQQ